MPGSRIAYAEGGGPDKRCYRVDFGKVARALPGFEPRWTVPEGSSSSLAAYRTSGLQLADFEGSRFIRLKTLQGAHGPGRARRASSTGPPRAGAAA